MHSPPNLTHCSADELRRIVTDPPKFVELDRWATWLLLGLHRHQSRQAWLGGVATRLGASPEEIGRHGPEAFPELYKGPIPELPGWHYGFHGRGCCFTSADGTKIDVDFPDGRVDVIERSSYSYYLSTLKNPDRVDAQLAHPKPFDDAWWFDLSTLQEAALVEKVAGGFCLTPAGQRTAQALEPLVEILEHPDPWRAAAAACLLNDPLLAQQRLVEQSPGQLLKRVSDCRSSRLQRLTPVETTAQLMALAAMGPICVDHLFTVLADPPERIMLHYAIDLVEYYDSPSLRPRLEELLNQIPLEDSYSVHVQLVCCRLLMADGEPGWLPALSQVVKHRPAEVGLLAYRGQPAEALKLLLDVARRHPDEYRRMGAAAALVLLGKSQLLREESGHWDPEVAWEASIAAALEPDPTTWRQLTDDPARAEDEQELRRRQYLARLVVSLLQLHREYRPFLTS